jgi:hypothetical protein
MPFSSSVAITGVPDFGLVHIDPEEVAKSLQTYLETASKLTGVSLDDISLAVISQPANGEKATLVDLLNVGMKLFDAIVWLTAGRPPSHPLVVDKGMKKENVPSLHTVARAVFYCYFMIVVQARYPVSGKTAAKDAPKIPNFLKTIMGMDGPQHEYVETICSFEPQKFDAKWAQHVSFSGLGQETLSRFGLGVAGYRYFAPFGLYETKDGLPDNLTAAVAFARTIAKTAPTWDIHPLTRRPDVLTKRGNLNKNLGNLLLDCFTEETLKEMEAAKVIYKVPIREPSHRNYLQWTVEDDISGNSYIFKT